MATSTRFLQIGANGKRRAVAVLMRQVVSESQRCGAIEPDAVAQIIAVTEGCPDEIAGAVAYLASSYSACISGSMLRVDGGLNKSIP